MGKEVESFYKQEVPFRSGAANNIEVNQVEEKTLGFLLEPVEALSKEELVSDGLCASCVVVSGCVCCILSW